MSVTWGGYLEASERIATKALIASSLDPEHPDPRAPRALSESLCDWVCRFVDVRLDRARMEEIAARSLGVTA